MPRVRVYLEVARRRTFAGAVDWPGWERSGRDEAAALEAFVAAGARYLAVVPVTDLHAPTSPDDLDVIERHEGGSGTEFGVPSRGPAADDEAVNAADLTRLTAILRAAGGGLRPCAAEAAVGIELRKGPRGGGRDLDKIVGHCSRPRRRTSASWAARHRRRLPIAGRELAADPGDRLELLASRAGRRPPRRRQAASGRPATSCAARRGTRSTTRGRSRTARPTGRRWTAKRPGARAPGLSGSPTAESARVVASLVADPGGPPDGADPPDAAANDHEEQADEDRE